VHIFVLLRELKSLSETFLILISIQRDMIMNVLSLNIKYSLFLPEF